MSINSVAFSDDIIDPILEESYDDQCPYHHVNFVDIPITEFIRFASKVSGENFIFNNKELDFHVTFSSGKPISAQTIVRSVVQLLRMHRFHVTKEENSYLIYKPSLKKLILTLLILRSDQVFSLLVMISFCHR